jgi:hypothetical protein
VTTNRETLPACAYAATGEGRWRSSELTRGPWHPEHQHAGPPIALVARQIERAASALGLLHVARLTANLLRPIPIAELGVAVQTDYAGRNAAHFSATLSSGGKEVARFTALAQREAELAIPESLPGHPLPQAPKLPDASAPAQFPFGQSFTGYPDLVECRTAEGKFFRGPCAIWFRLRRPLIAGEQPTAIERVAVAADSGNGISAILDFQRYVFVNSDLTIHLLRRPLGEWICIQAQTLLGPSSCGIAEARIYDTRGLVGRSVQSLALRRRE